MLRRRGDGRALALAAALVWAGLAGSAPASGDPAGVALAPPGECAEPQAGVHVAPDAKVLLPDTKARAADAAGDDFELAGSPRHHFTPQDVAAGPSGAGTELPQPLVFSRDACDAPNAGCGSLLDDAARGLKESTVQPGLPPGAATQGGGQ